MRRVCRGLSYRGRRLIGQEMTSPRSWRLSLQDRVFYEDSGGGVTFSGGEPLSQPDFLRALLESCRACGMHTAVDTCGLARTEQLLAIAPLTDLFLYDLKFMDDARHREYTGAPNALILENLQALGRAGGADLDLGAGHPWCQRQRGGAGSQSPFRGLHFPVCGR